MNQRDFLTDVVAQAIDEAVAAAMRDDGDAESVRASCIAKVVGHVYWCDLDPAEFLRDAGWSVHAKQFKRDGQWVVDADAWPPRWLATNAVSSGPCSSFNEALQSVMRVIKQKFGSDAARKKLEPL